MKLVLADADLALVPAGGRTGRREPGAVLLQRSGLVDALDALFETVWRSAYPLELSGLDGRRAADDEHGDGRPDRPGPTDPQPAAGRPERPGGRRPSSDLSLRTVQRRLRHLQDVAGVQTRMQLGWYAARHGWA